MITFLSLLRVKLYNNINSCNMLGNYYQWQTW